MEPWITEPGRYDLSEADYHRDPVVGGSLSSTGARLLLPPGSPARFKYEREHGRADTDAFDLGRAAHAVVLGVGAEIGEVDAKSWQTNAAKDARDEHRAAGRTPLLSKDVERVHAMAEALRRHRTAGPLFARAGDAEQSFVARDPETGVMCRVRVDFMPHVGEDARVIAVDYKTAKSAYPAAFAKSMADYGYFQQGAFYCDALTWLDLDHGIEPQFVLVAQEKDPPYLVTVGWPSARAIEWGRIRNRKARAIYRRCVETGEWPGYGDEPVELDIPDWLDRQYSLAYDLGEYSLTEDIA